MNTWVEYWKFTDKRNNTHAQMRENAHWVEPDPKEIQRRFFDDPKDAKEFSKRMFDSGFHTRIKTDGY